MSLRVKEALAKDVGHGIARMDPQDMKKYGLSEGQIVLIEGKRQTPVRILSCDSSDMGQQIVQIDGIIRENAHVGLDEKIKVLKTDHHFAGSIALRPLTTTPLLEKERDSIYLSSQLEGLPVLKGDRIRGNTFWDKNMRFSRIRHNARQCCDY
jgi:transitional endoplasmic reticulum ATPase